MPALPTALTALFKNCLKLVASDASYADYDGSTVYTTLQAYEQQPSVPYVVEPPTNETAARDAAFFK